MAVTIHPMDVKIRCTIFVTKHPVGANAMTISDFIALQSARNKKEPRPKTNEEAKSDECNNS